MSQGHTSPPAILSIPRSELFKLTPLEIWWRDHQEWLSERGYMLRPRYRPGWKPSWEQPDADPKKSPRDYEDGQNHFNMMLLDAVRKSDNVMVALKRVIKEHNPLEVEMIRYISSPTLLADPRNHSVPILDVLPVPDDPDSTVIVMPFLRPCDKPPFNTVGELVSFLKQILEGLQFMHEHNFAHRDCKAGNIMYDPSRMYPDMYHPDVRDKTRDLKRKARHSTRTAHPVRYYYIDFGLSRRYNPDDGPPREHPILGGDKTVPEFQNWNGELLDPFPTDIYYVGNIVRASMGIYQHVDFLAPLAKDMVQSDPSKRPVIQDVVKRFDELARSLTQRKLRSRLRPAREHPFDSAILDVFHTFRTVRYILGRKSAIPLP